MAVRAFLALDIDDAVRRRLAGVIAELGAAGAKVRWVAPQNLHVTIKFLGDVAEGDLAELCRVVADVASKVEPFEFRVRGVQCVPPAGRPRMVWAEVDEPGGRLALMFQRLEAALTELGFEPERRAFHPHVTLGRVKFAQRPPGLRAAADRHARSELGPTRAGDIVIYGSQLAPAGAIYTPLARGRFSGT